MPMLLPLRFNDNDISYFKWLIPSDNDLAPIKSINVFAKFKSNVVSLLRDDSIIFRKQTPYEYILF